MKRGSSHRGDMRESTFTDPGAKTRAALEISRKSRAIARAAIGDRTPEDRIRQRCSIAVGDLGMANLLRFRNVCSDSNSFNKLSTPC